MHNRELYGSLELVKIACPRRKSTNLQSLRSNITCSGQGVHMHIYILVFNKLKQLCNRAGVVYFFQKLFSAHLSFMQTDTPTKNIYQLLLQAPITVYCGCFTIIKYRRIIINTYFDIFYVYLANILCYYSFK